MENGSGPKRSDIWEDDPVLEGVVRSIAEVLVSGDITDREELQDLKIRTLRNSGLDRVPTNSVILDYIGKNHPEMTKDLLPLLLKKPSRTISGVAVVAAMTSPHDCPHGRCVFCPGGTEKDVATPQSYTGREPAAMRGAQNGYDPYRQVVNRIGQLKSIGHSTDKIDLILMGGTLTARDIEYQEGFVKGCLDGMNGLVSGDLDESMAGNEKADHRCIGITFETRPDHCFEKEVDDMLRIGGTSVELGFQSAFNEALEASRRGHTVEDAVRSTRIMKDAGLKVSYHLMPGMPGSDTEMDVNTAERIFKDERFMPDRIKIYPTLVIEGTELHDMWKRGEYEPLSTDEAAKVVARIKQLVPPWVRISRVQRDIPSPLVEAGVKKSNLRQLAQKELEAVGGRCRCIRCREIGHRIKDEGLDSDDVRIEIVRREYDASGGQEVFLSYEVPKEDILIGYIRLRNPSSVVHRPEVDTDKGTALIREVKVFGAVVPIGRTSDGEWQHQGYGRKLIAEAERISKEEWGMKRILVTAGVGVREYYRKLGYERVGPYMGKDL